MKSREQTIYSQRAAIFHVRAQRRGVTTTALVGAAIAVAVVVGAVTFFIGQNSASHVTVTSTSTTTVGAGSTVTVSTTFSTTKTVMIGVVDADGDGD